MKLILVLSALMVGIPAFATAKRMPRACAQQLLANPLISEGSVSSSPQDIVNGLKYDWKNNPGHDTASYSDCGASDFYYVIVNKATCTVTDSGAGDSDGECN